MSKLVWDAIGERIGEVGVKQGVLYNWDNETSSFKTGVAWNGLTAVNESPTGAEATPFYADDQKYLEITSAEEFGGSIEAYTYPDEYKPCIGEAEIAPGITVGQQNRAVFGMAYRTTIVNDTNGMEHGYKIHLVYNARASVSEAAYTTINDSPEIITFNWDFTTTPVEVPNLKSTARVVIDSTKIAEADKPKLAALEAILYGTDATTEPAAEATVARLPLPAEIITLFAQG